MSQPRPEAPSKFPPTFGIRVGGAKDNVTLSGQGFGEETAARRQQAGVRSPGFVQAMMSPGILPPTHLAISMADPIVTEAHEMQVDYPGVDYSAAKEYRPIVAFIRSMRMSDESVVLTRWSIEKVDASDSK